MSYGWMDGLDIPAALPESRIRRPWLVKAYDVKSQFCARADVRWYFSKRTSGGLIPGDNNP